MKITEILNKNINKDKNRIFYLDVARMAAILCVILCHCTEFVYNTELQHNQLDDKIQIVKIMMFTIGRLGVPLFLFISGSLLLNKKMENDENIFHFYKKNLIPLLLTTEIWILIYNVFLAATGVRFFSLKNFIKEILFIQKTPLPNMWYMPMILGVYIVIPFMAKIVNTFNIKSLLPAIFTLLFYTSLLPTINVIRNSLNASTFNYVIDVSFLGGIYGVYILFGYFINKKFLRKIKTNMCLMISLVFFIMTIALQYWAYKHNNIYNVWYDCIFLIITTAFLYEVICRIEHKNFKCKNLVEYISRISLAIFFIHIIIINLIGTYIADLNIDMSIKIIVLSLMVFIISFVLITILSCARFIKEKIFLIK